MFKNSINLSITTAFIFVLFCSTPHLANAQTIFEKPEELEALILSKDKQFWEAYNQCDVARMVSFLTEDLEFYHDKNGFTKGRDSMQKSLSSGLCANGPRLRREVKEGTIRVYPLQGIGALISGEHSFFINGKADSGAKFTHLWTFQNSEWKMSRIFSYDHMLATAVDKHTEFSIDEKVLAKYLGEYEAPQTGKVVFAKVDGKLNMKAGKMELSLIPESNTKFFHAQSGLSFEFISNESGQVIKVLVREGGTVVEEAKRIN